MCSQRSFPHIPVSTEKKLRRKKTEVERQEGSIEEKRGSFLKAKKYRKYFVIFVSQQTAQQWFTFFHGIANLRAFPHLLSYIPYLLFSPRRAVCIRFFIGKNLQLGWEIRNQIGVRQGKIVTEFKCPPLSPRRRSSPQKICKCK